MRRNRIVLVASSALLAIASADAASVQEAAILFECDFERDQVLLFTNADMIGNGSMRSRVGERGSASEWGFNNCDAPSVECQLTSDEFHFRSSSIEGRIDRRTGRAWEQAVSGGRVIVRNEGVCRASGGQAALPPPPQLNTYVGTGNGWIPPETTSADQGGSGWNSDWSPDHSTYSGLGSGSSTGYAYCMSFRQAPGTEPTTYFSDIFVQPSHGYTGQIAGWFTSYISASYDDRATIGSGGSCNSNLPSLGAAEDARDSDASRARVDGREVVFTNWWPEADSY